MRMTIPTCISFTSSRSRCLSVSYGDSNIGSLYCPPTSHAGSHVLTRKYERHWLTPVKLGAISNRTVTVKLGPRESRCTWYSNVIQNWLQSAVFSIREKEKSQQPSAEKNSIKEVSFIKKRTKTRIISRITRMRRMETILLLSSTWRWQEALVAYREY